MSQSVLCSPLTGSLTALGTEGQGWLKGAEPTAADLCMSCPWPREWRRLHPLSPAMEEWFGMGGISTITYVLNLLRSTLGMPLVEVAGGSCEDRDCRGHMSGSTERTKIQQ